MLSAGTCSATSPTTAYVASQAEALPHITPTAVTGADGYLWLAGTYPCATGTCPVLMRSADGGSTWARVGSPPQSIDVIHFANRTDGYAYFPGGDIRAHILYWTGDGGKNWRRALTQFPNSPGPLVVTANGRAYALVSKDCSASGCKSLDLASSAVTGDLWTTRRLSLTPHEVNSDVELAAFGSKVWVIVAAAGENAAILVSNNGGRTFANLPSRGMLGGLDCRATATSATTLWGFCATGSLGYPVRSTNGGRDFKTLSGWRGEAANAGVIIPLTNTDAIFLPGGPDMWLTRDGGRHFTSLLQFPNPSASSEIAIAGTATWLDYTPGEPHSLLRTTNGGRSWQPVQAPNVPTTPLDQFSALVRHGLRVPFEASYRFVPQTDGPDFRIWSEPAVGKEHEGNFVYEATFRRGTFRFIQNRKGDYECLRLSPKSAWKCVGPFGPKSIGQIMTIEGYRLPLFIAGQIDDGLAAPLVFFHKTVLGRRLWCLNVRSEGYLCLNKTGQLALVSSLFVSGQLEAVSLTLNPSTAAFVPPAKPTPWTKDVLPNLCGAVQCPSNGMA